MVATHRMSELAQQIVELQQELDREIEQRRRQLGWKLREKIGEFELGITMEHKRLRTSAASFVANGSLASILTAPVIYSMIVPLVLLDVWASLYQAICFRAYRIPPVKRSDYIALDRKNLAYLNWIEELNCLYCGYGNGVVAYVREIASRTEQFWCPIKHAVAISNPHDRYVSFVEFGDADGYRARLSEFRARLRAVDHPSSSPDGKLAQSQPRP